jgi:hypothetical protein
MSKIFREVKRLVNEGILESPFNVNEIKNVSPILKKSGAFISKHALGNSKGYTPYFIRHTRGYYSINSQFN